MNTKPNDAIEDLAPAIQSKGSWKLQLDSGLEIVGNVADQLVSSEGRLIYFNFGGATELRYLNQVIEGQGHARHPHGFSSPIGALEDFSKPLWQLSETELCATNIKVGNGTELRFTSGIKVCGVLTQIERRAKRIVIATFKDCTVTQGSGRTLFKPEWGSYDMAVGDKITQLIKLR